MAEIQKALVQNGAKGILQKFDDEGRITALQFILEIEGKELPFALPVEWRKFQALLKQQGVSRATDDDYCYRVAWRCVRDWVLAQLAFFETQMVSVPQVFLPFATAKDGRTLAEHIVDNPQFLLGNGNQNE